jgi:hypothetical protein
MKLIVFLDPDGDIVDQVSENNSSDFILAVADELTKSRGEEITPHYASIEVGEKYKDKIHQDSGLARPAVAVRMEDALATCHKYGICYFHSDAEDEFDVLSRCRICPRRDK